MTPELKQPDKKKLRAALYLRVSTDEQAKEGHYGLEVQEERGRSFCESQEYVLEETHIYQDDISGGLPVEKRPKLKELFESAQRKEFDVVVVYKTDRLARNLRILVNAIHDLEKIGIAFRSVTEPFDTSTSFGRANLNLFGTFAEFEKEMIRERTMNGKLKAAKAGKWATGIPPYGYKVDKKTRKLVLIPEEAKVVQQIYKWLVDEKLPLREIERRMNRMKIPPPYSTKIKVRTTYNYWYARTIGRIATNQVYTGHFVYRKYRRPFCNLTSLVDESKHRPKEDWVEIETPPVISPEMFELAKKQLVKNRDLSKRNQKREYMYAKLIWCGKCSYKLFSGFQPPRKHWEGSGGRYYHGVYRKPDAVGTTQRCDWCPQYGETRLEPIWESLKDILKNPKNVYKPLERYIYKEQDPATIHSRLEEIAKELTVIREKQKRVAELYIDNQIDRKQHESYSSEYKLEEQKLGDESTKLRQTLLTKKEKSDREVAIRNAYEQIKDRLDTVSYEEKTQIIRFFIERITLYARDNYAEVVFRFPQTTETKSVKLVSQQPTDFFPLILNIKTMSENERRVQILKSNPLMYIPKTLV